MERKKQDFNRPVLAGRHSQATASELQRYVELQCILSRNDSVFENGSTSALDGSHAVLPGTVSAHQMARDFMMRRFLTAAKAKASETPPHCFKKMHVVGEQPKQVTVGIKAARPNVSSCHVQNGMEKEDSEKEDLDFEEDQRNILGNARPLLGASSLSGLRMLPQTRAGRVPVNRLRTAQGMKWASEISSSANHRINEIFEDRSSPSVESASTQNGYFQCNNHDEKRFAGTSAESKNARNFSTGPKDIKTLEYFMRRQNSEHESEPESIVVEKTLYIDSGQGSLVETMENPQLPVPPPPLPNPPSDSWLCRALSFISSRNQSSQSYQASPMQEYSEQQAPREIRLDPKCNGQNF